MWKYNIKRNQINRITGSGSRFVWLRIGTSCGLHEDSNEAMGSTNSGEFIDQMSNHSLLKEICDAWT
jgi:hypothetical protein